MQKESSILVIIATYRAKEWLRECLAPFVVSPQGIDVLVVDNASDDGTVEEIRSSYPFVRLHCRPSGIGIPSAYNIGIEYALTEGYSGVLLLRQDTSICIDDLRHAVARAESRSDIGLIPLPIRDSQVVSSEDSCAGWYMPRHTLERVGLFCPLFEDEGADRDYSNRILAAGLCIGDSADHGASYPYPLLIPSSGEEHNDRAFHLSEFIHPHYSALHRLWSGPLSLALKGLTHRSRVDYRSSKELWAMRKSVQLWRERPPIDLDALHRVMRPKSKAPVLLLLYDRPRHTRRVLDYLMRQPEIMETPLYILSDGAKSDERSRGQVAEVRKIATQIKELLPDTTLWFQEENVGLARNVTEGVGRVLEIHDRVIVVEDDLILSPYFLRWMNDVLETHAADSKVAHVHAGTFYTSRALSNNHTLRFAGSWGWATWRDRWQKYWEPDGVRLLRRMKADDEARRHFDYGGFQKFTRMLERQTKGQNNSWAVRWHASLVLHHLLSINANPPLVSNGGFDGSGTHSSADDRYATPVAPYPLYASTDNAQAEDALAYRILKRYYIRTNNKIAKGWYKLKELRSRLGRR